MIKLFTQEQQKTIDEKVRLLTKIRDGTLSPKKLADMITQRGLDWLESNRPQLNRENITPEMAYKFMIYWHMKVEDGIKISMNGRVLRVEARNFCPYLEASQLLEMDTRFVCKEIGEPSLRALFQQMNPRLHFLRDYERIRPHHDCCLEFLKLGERQKCRKMLLLMH